MTYYRYIPCSTQFFVPFPWLPFLCSFMFLWTATTQEQLHHSVYEHPHYTAGFINTGITWRHHDVTHTIRAAIGNFYENCSFCPLLVCRFAAVRICSRFRCDTRRMYTNKFLILVKSRSRWQSGRRRKYAASHLLRLWFRFPPEAWMSVWVLCVVR